MSKSLRAYKLASVSLRFLLAAVTAAIGFAIMACPARAASTGQIAGIVTDPASKPLAGVTVTATSPTGVFRAVTDGQGHFIMAGVTLDTYLVTFTRQGYAMKTVAGVTVTADETVRLTIRLDKQASTLAVVRVRSVTSAFQPHQTIDRYTVNATGISQLLGKAFDTDQRRLLRTLPSVTINKSGTPLIRGGFSYQTSLQVEGIDYTEPNRSLINRFENFGNSDVLNGVASVEIIPGGSDATHGDSGTGLIAYTIKRGSYPGFGTVDLEDTFRGDLSQIGFEYGIASPNGQLSNYISYVREQGYFTYGWYGTDPAGILGDPSTQDPSFNTLFARSQQSIYTTAVFNKSWQSNQDLVDNFIYKFGENQHEALQVFVQQQIIHTNLDYGGFKSINAVPQTIFFQNNPNVNPANAPIDSLNVLFGAPPCCPNDAELAFISRFVQPTPFGSPGQPLSAPETIDSPFHALKFDYTTFWPTSSLGARVYQTAMSQSETLPSRGLYVPQSGGLRTGAAMDYTSVVRGGKHTLQFGAKYEFAVPYGELNNYVDYQGAFDGQYSAIGGTFINLGRYTHDIFADFASSCNVAAPGGPPQEHCGYLASFFPNGIPQLPIESEVPTAKQQVYGLYGQDTFTPNPRLKLLIGLRLDGYNYLIPSDPQNPPAVNGLQHQHELEPHFGTSYQLGPNDTIRVNFGRTLAIPLPSFLGLNINRAAFAQFAGIPSFDSVTGKPATYCGPAQPIVLYGNTYYAGNQACADYADQLYWLIRNARFFGQSQITYPLRGATFDNFDASYSHEFPDGVALRLTPFYRRGYDIVEQSQTLLGIDPVTGAEQLSPLVYSNLGMQKATGLEFYVTTPRHDVGWSGQFTLTYINQIGNDPPGDYLPTASVQLGLLYHSPTVAPLQSTLALSYKNKNGLLINPIFHFRSGYPYGVGVYQAYTINGQPFYIPNTNVLYPGVFSTQLAAALANPQFPGPITGPSIAAVRGADAITSGPGSLYSQPALNTDITIAIDRGVRYGILITNVTNVTAGLPAPNYAVNCQLVYAGQCSAFGTPNVQDQYHHIPVVFGSASGPYVVYPNQPPMQVRAFIQASF